LTDLHNTLILGDCLDKMQEIPSGSVDCVIADLPYGTTQNRWDMVIPMDELWSAWQRICRPGAPVILFTQQPFTTTVAASNLKHLRTEWIWEKPQGTNFLNAKRYPMKVHENILVFCDRSPAYYPQKTAGHTAYTSSPHKGSSNYGSFKVRGIHIENAEGTRLPRTVLQFKPDRGLHPTQKPVSLIEYLIITYTQANAVILDCCAGSGSTAIAALNTGRSFICIEQDPGYHAGATQRITDHIASIAPIQAEQIAA
jgi:DNA modification methylase